MNSIAQSTKFEFDLSGLQHLVCVENESVSLICDRLEELDSVPEHLDILHLGKLTVTDRKLHIDSFDSLASLTAKVTEILSRAFVGTRFYALGSEQFIGNLRNQAIDLGMSVEEITLVIAGLDKRQVYCSVCHEINPQVNTNIISCYNCGTKLEVWSHYSQLKNAYLGVCADAEEVLL